MPTNPYFSSQSASGLTMERRLLEDLIVETIKINGLDVYVIPRETDSTVDMIYGEDPLKKFARSYCVEMYLNNTTEFGGAGNFFSKFGLEIRDDTTFVVARRSFMRHVPDGFRRVNGGPREGDLIWVPLMNALFEIKSIEEEKTFFALGNKSPYYYELTCERYRYANEKFTTGIDTVDDILIHRAYLIKFNLAASGNGKYIKYETVYQSNTGPLSPANIALANTAVVEEYNNVLHTLNVAHIKGIFSTGTTVWGANSNASYVLTSYNNMINERVDDIVDNRRLEVEANVIVDFTATNPFGMP